MENSEVTLASLMLEIPDELAAYTWLESIRWPNGPICPHCGVIGHAYHLQPKNGGRKTRTGAVSQRKVWKCGDCRKQFTVTIGTCMERSKIPMRKWALAFHLFAGAKNGLSSHELGRLLKISHESAWFMSQRIRYAFTTTTPMTMLTGTVEADETYYGGKRKTIPGVSPFDLKMPVVTLVERDGEARSQVMTNVTGDTIKEFLTDNISGGADLMTDESNVYAPSSEHFASHETVKHKDEEYVRGNVHVNSAEGYFSQLKRSLDGTHHHVTYRHLHRYVGEFDFRYTTRKMKDGERTAAAIRKSAGKRLMYEQVTKKSITSVP